MTGIAALLRSLPGKKIPRKFDGSGKILAPGRKPARVHYHLIVDGSFSKLRCYGNLRGRFIELHPMWLEPVVILRCDEGYRIPVSITELDGDNATFEFVEA